MYSVALSHLVPMRRARRLVAAQLTIDESTAVAISAPRSLAGVGFWTAGIAVYVLWNLATLLGAVGAATVDTHAFGLDAAVGAAFLGLLWPRLAKAGGGSGAGGRSQAGGLAKARGVAAAGAVLAAVAVPLTPLGVPVLLAGLVVLPILVRPPRRTTGGGGRADVPGRQR